MNEPFVSIIIPVYNDPLRLRGCLDKLAVQTYPQTRFEVIVVDNGSTPPIDLIETSYGNVHTLYETKPGSYVARNSGITRAKGEILAFTDADCLPEPDWLAIGVAAIMADPKIGLVAGRVDVFPYDIENVTIAERYEMVRGFPVKEYIERWNFGVTANIFTRQEIFNIVGLFDDTLKSGGDSEWCKRVYSAGYQTNYSDTAVVRHPALPKVRDIWRKARRVAGGLHEMYSRQHPPIAYFRYGFWHDLFPPVKKTIAHLQRPKTSLLHRLQLVYVEWVYNYGRMAEWVRLILGGEARRR